MADVMATDNINFKYPSYVQDIMGPMCFDYGLGLFPVGCVLRARKAILILPIN